jgi:TRAP-type transport system periplasmic protein
MDRIWDNGFRQITTSTKAIVEPADLQALNLRVPISALWVSLFQSLGAAPGGIDFAEVYAALQARIFDGQENPLAIISTARLNEVQTYCSLTNHMWDGWWVLMNRPAWERLPPSIQEVVSKNLNAAASEQRRDSGYYVHWRNNFGEEAWSLLEEATGILT